MPATILYVDDEADNLSVFEAMYDRVFAIRTATSGDRALAVLRDPQSDVGVVLTDQRMPGMTGIDLAEVVHREFPDVVILLITAFADLAAVIDAINRGEVHRYLRKPWDVGDLELALREALSVYDMRRRIADLERSLYDTGQAFAADVAAAEVSQALASPVLSLRLMLDEVGVGLSRLNVRESSTSDLSQLREVLGDANELAGHIESLVEGLRPPVGEAAPLEDVDVGEVTGTVLRMLRRDLQRRARLSFESLPAPTVRGSRNRIGQLARNLVVRSLRSLPSRAPAENLLRVQVRGLAGAVQLLVEDNGLALAPDQPRVLQESPGAWRFGDGSLDLAITQHAVRACGGRLMVEPLPVGTRFRVLLPIAPPDESPPDAR